MDIEPRYDHSRLAGLGIHQLKRCPARIQRDAGHRQCVRIDFQRNVMDRQVFVEFENDRTVARVPAFQGEFRNLAVWKIVAFAPGWAL